jgi:hypothetical protein
MPSASAGIVLYPTSDRTDMGARPAFSIVPTRSVWTNRRMRLRECEQRRSAGMIEQDGAVHE